MILFRQQGGSLLLVGGPVIYRLTRTRLYPRLHTGSYEGIILLARRRWDFRVHPLSSCPEVRFQGSSVVLPGGEISGPICFLAPLRISGGRLSPCLSRGGARAYACVCTWTRGFSGGRSQTIFCVDIMSRFSVQVSFRCLCDVVFPLFHYPAARTRPANFYWN